MKHWYRVEVTLTILGPFLTAATSADRYGLDKTFFRNYLNKLAIPYSHIKGRLKMALEELTPVLMTQSVNGAAVDIEGWFGEPSGEHVYTPTPAMIRFTDFICADERPWATRTRTKIHRTTQTAAENMLHEVEDAYASGGEYQFSGAVTFLANDDSAAEALAKILRIGFLWLPSLGAEKGVGFGRLKSVQVAKPERQQQTLAPIPQVGSDSTLNLRITPLEPILIGGVKSRRTNFVHSRRELSGGLIKGALAAALNEAHGVYPVHRSLDASNSGEFPGYETLVAHYADIRVTTALPVLAGGKRPVRLPLSTVKVGGKMGDVALNDNDPPLIAGQAPDYFADWKQPQTYFGDAQPERIFVTRAEINDQSRRTEEGQLFTYAFFCPHEERLTMDEALRKIEWVANVDFNKINDDTERHKAKVEFAKAVQLHLHRLGKLARQVEAAIADGPVQPCQPSRALIEDGFVLVTLQSDAILLNPQVVANRSPDESLHPLYAKLWGELSGNTLELVDFYAHQGFEGGYLYHRYLGSAERHVNPYAYQPYYLTLAGSVFKLRVKQEAGAMARLQTWLDTGIPLPAWANDLYTQFGRDAWQNCPFVPENGFGEVAVNLAWHWDYAL